jgi:beta-lactamase regulating signal transducer with metallopeptidase domain
MTPHFESLGWTLIHFCWQAAAIAIAYKVADTILSSARSHVRYLVALAALLAMFLSAAATLTYEETRIRQTATTPSTAQPLVDSVLATFASAPAASIPATFDPSVPATSHPFNLVAALPWLDALWMLGVLALSLRTIGGWLLIQRLRTTAVANIPPDLAATFLRLSRRIGLKRSIDLRLSAHIASPVAIGIFRSLVLLPVSALTTLSPDQLEAVLAHELAHIRRADYLWNLLQTVIETLFFFHPAVWWIGSNLRQQRELCCDDIAVASCADPLTYATALLLLEEQRSAQLHLAMALDGNQPRFTLRSRIARILGDTTQPRQSNAPVSFAAVCGALLLLVLPIPHLYAALQNVAHPIASPAPAPQPEALVAPASASAANPSPAAQPAPVSLAMAKPESAPPASSTAEVDDQQSNPGDKPSHPIPADVHSDYITRMRAAGYDTDLDNYIAMKIQGITPEYAQQMAQLGYGKPDVGQLIALKVQGVTPAYAEQLKANGIQIEKLHDLISFRIFNVTPDYIAAMKSAGFPNIPTKQIIDLRVQNVTPDFARATKQQFPDATVNDLVQLRIFNINAAFIARAKQLGITPLTIHKLVQLQVSGILDDQNSSQTADQSARQ